MFPILSAVVCLCVAGLLALIAGRRSLWADVIGAGGGILGCLVGLIAAGTVLWSGHAEQLRWAWNVPLASFSVRVDALSALFLLPICLLCGLAAVYGSSAAALGAEGKSPGVFWFFFNILAASMIMVAVAANGILFLMSWEIMALSSFFLVTFEDRKESVRRAGWIYLVATHLGTVLLLVLFLLLGRQVGGASLDFDRFLAMRAQMAPIADGAFLLALVGFGTKAGFVPCHVWLPEAHPAAPSHVSAVMSGVMIKTGIYALLRTLSFLGPPPLWWGWLLLGIGLVSGILGVLFALAQHDLKRLLAYHSVENIGIISLGLGMGFLGLAAGLPVLTVLGFAGALLHVINHALFKGLLFLGAGAVVHATGTRELDRLGGLIKRMPWTGATFLVGAVAISGLPPLNGFISEFLVYSGAFRAVGQSATAVAGAAVVIGLALIGGLAAACFTKAFGIVFLGEPRSESASRGHEVSWAQRSAMLLLAAGCVAVAFGAPWAVQLTAGAVGVVSGLATAEVQKQLVHTLGALTMIVLVGTLLVGLMVVLAWLRHCLLANRSVTASGTWDCGYTRPSARMQYTASSFAQPLTRMFGAFLRPRVRWRPAEGLFPVHAAFHTATADLFDRTFYRPLFRGIERLALRLRFLQAGRVQLYILYIALTIFILLIWNLG